jgi:hypothetical protein
VWDGDYFEKYSTYSVWKRDAARGINRCFGKFLGVSKTTDIDNLDPNLPLASPYSIVVRVLDSFNCAL